MILFDELLAQVQKGAKTAQKYVGRLNTQVEKEHLMYELVAVSPSIHWQIEEVDGRWKLTPWVNVVDPGLPLTGAQGGEYE